eukprot:CAMPEP_0180380032 /NCGR_PEP_ID=MMETSP0989-20121125/25737_1 /TAXON_ID=697907 /ORGANISM="non described non described, Strain CCMP2293" /LENGTH=49 /DNA_ID= /DNA_START= /DNA_END= /DNA_ORIENTATION=
MASRVCQTVPRGVGSGDGVAEASEVVGKPPPVAASPPPPKASGSGRREQ